MTLCPFNSFLLKVINLIKQKDVGEIFIEPVDQNEVPDYGDIVQYPMDLQTMADKVRNFQYHSLETLEADFNLMISNCLAYNAKHTIFYKSGLRMKEQVQELALLLNVFSNNGRTAFKFCCLIGWSYYQASQKRLDSE